MDFAKQFSQALSYQGFLEQHATDAHRALWAASFQRIQLSNEQQQLLEGFQRDMKVLVMAGAWCGDCVEQCPIFQRFAECSPRIDLRFVDRDQSDELKGELVLCGAARVPQVVFISEDDHPVGRYGDRTLAKYRNMAATLGGAACPSGIIPPADDLLSAVVQDWLDEFERNQLILRTSGRLRQKHGD